jgi:hypothetical protein
MAFRGKKAMGIVHVVPGGEFHAGFYVFVSLILHFPLVGCFCSRHFLFRLSQTLRSICCVS